MDFLDIMNQRKSCRAYDPAKQVSREDLLKIVEAGRLTPSGCNAQPWKFIVVDEPAAKASLCDALVVLDGITTVEAAQVLRGKMLYVDRRDLKLPKGHYLVQDLIGLTIVDADDKDKVYGTLTDVSQTGANAVYHMQTEKGEVLIPAIPDVVVEINLKKDILRLRPMKGLLDDDEI